MTRPDEDAVLARFFRPLARHPAALGLADDAAHLNGHVYTKDMLVAGQHFFPDDDPALIARKALRVNLSDLAAKGAEPVGYLFGLGLPPDWSEAFLARLTEGLKADNEAFNLALLGGDTVKSPVLMLSVTMIGRAREKTPLRTGAKPGDVIAVTGTLGDGAFGLMVRQGGLSALSAEHRAFLLDRYLLPQPRLALGAALSQHASASMDVSDGLVQDLERLLKASGCAGTVDASLLPLSEAGKAAVASEGLTKTLTGGDDYEILFTCTEQAFAALQTLPLPFPLTRIGAVQEGSGLTLLNAPALTAKGWQSV